MAIELVAPIKFRRTGYNIVLVGTGGTGGYLANYLAKSIALVNASRRTAQHCLTIVDGDRVEDKNVTRQNFTTADVGRFKSEVLAERYGNAYGVEIYFSTEYVATKTKLNQIFKFSNDRIANKEYSRYRYGMRTDELVPVLVGCVDSHRVRAKVFHEWYHTVKNDFNPIWVDCGNEKTNGQVVFGNKVGASPGAENIDSFNSGIKRFKKLMADGQQHRAAQYIHTPCVTDLHPEIMEASRPVVDSQVFSCAEAAVQDPQTMRANLHSAMFAYNYLDDLIFGREISSHAAYFSTSGGTTLRLNKTYLTLRRQVFAERHCLFLVKI